MAPDPGSGSATLAVSRVREAGKRGGGELSVWVSSLFDNIFVQWVPKFQVGSLIQDCVFAVPDPKEVLLVHNTDL